MKYYIAYTVDTEEDGQLRKRPFPIPFCRWVDRDTVRSDLVSFFQEAAGEYAADLDQPNEHEVGIFSTSDEDIDLYLRHPSYPLTVAVAILFEHRDAVLQELFPDITHWSNGRDPYSFGWIINGVNWTAHEISKFDSWDEMAKDLPENLVAMARESAYEPNEMDVWMQENYR
jgi:hypothetical protein